VARALSFGLTDPNEIKAAVRARLEGLRLIEDEPHPKLGTPCWRWTGRYSNPLKMKRVTQPYGRTWVGAAEAPVLFGPGHGRKEYAAHRVMFAACVEVVRPDMHIDHLCRNRSCINPAHLRQVDVATNMRDANHHRWHHDPNSAAFDYRPPVRAAEDAPEPSSVDADSWRNEESGEGGDSSFDADAFDF
jgi:hypothetical protein